MFRSYGKAAVIAAVAASCSYASAATLTVNNRVADVSKEGATETSTALLISTAANGGSVTLQMGSFQSRDNVIRLSLGGITGAKFATMTPSVSCGDGNIVLDVPSRSAASSSIEFGITATSGTNSSTTCTFRSLSVLPSSLSAGGTLTLTSAVKRVSDTDFVYDPATAVPVLTVTTQVSSITVLSALNGTVDYAAQAGLGFADDDNGAGTGAGKGDVLSFVIGSKENMTLSSTTALTFSIAVNAESGKTFSWLDDAPGGATAAINRDTSSGRVYAYTGTNTLITGQPTINTGLNQITVTGAAVMTGTATRVSLEFQHKSATPSTGLAITAMTFPAASGSVSNGTATSLNATSLTGVGSWITNGTTVKIPYMPINTTLGTTKIDPIIVIGNRSSTVGTVTVTTINARGQSCSGTLGTIDGNSTKSFGGSPLRAVLNACSNYNIAAGEQMSITLVATLAEDTTDIFTGYNADTGRVTVVNNKNGR